MKAILARLQTTFFGTRLETVCDQFRDQCGQSWAELTLLLPILLLLSIGTIDVGMGFRTFIALTHSAREGVRWITIYPDDPAGAVARITTEAARKGLSPGAIGSDGFTIEISPPKVHYDAGDVVTVTISHEYPLMFGSFIGLPTIPFQGKAKMVVLYDE